MNIAIVYTLPTKRQLRTQYAVSDEDTVLSAQKIERALLEKKAHTQLIGLSEDSIEQTIRSIRAGLIFNLIDWTGLDLPKSMRAMKELFTLGIPVTGASPKNFSYVDKVEMKKALDSYNLPTARWQVFHTGDEPLYEFCYPVLVKLAQEHCSIGLEKTSYVEHPKDLQNVVKDRITRFSQDVFAEEFIKGREFHVTLLERASGLMMLPPAEIIYDAVSKPSFLTFSERWDENDPEYFRSKTTLAELSEEQLDLFDSVCTQTFRKLGFSDFTRIDIRLRGEKDLFILEANPNPGLDDDSDYSITISATAMGLSFSDFVWEIVESTLRHTEKA